MKTLFQIQLLTAQKVRRCVKQNPQPKMLMKALVLIRNRRVNYALSKKISAKQKHIKNDNGTVKETNDNNNVGNDAEQIENNTANTYTLSITCINAVNYANSHNMSLPAAIPSDGVILKSVTDEFNAGDSVMKVLKSTLKANGISYQITSGGYVRSISGLAEFDCGQGSGWMYKVNGVLPNVSCKSYKLTNGDKIEFVFTCNLGNDV